MIPLMWCLEERIGSGSGLGTFLKQVRAKLKPGGKIVFLENAKESWLMHRLRAFRQVHGIIQQLVISQRVK